MKRVVVFGNLDFAQLAHYYLTNDSEYEVAGFCVESKFRNDQNEFLNLPLVDFETVEKRFDPKEFVFFAPISSQGMNKFRERIFLQAKMKGYKLISYISSKCTRFNNDIGENCFILEDNTIQPFTSIGDNVVLWSGNHIGHHGKIMDHVFFTSHVVMSGHCIISPYSFLGVNSSLRDGITIGEGTLVGMGAVVTKNTELWSVMMGFPAKPTGKNSFDVL